ncbi:MAG: NUDIX domain-containing protein [Pseudomonadota bacterium]|nr:NUDIX domain-containing protein [Pseudomonadota bacterium]
MPRKTQVSAGLLVWRKRAGGAGVEYLLGHPGGPYWASKDEGAWSIPKGAVESGHDLLATAQREFAEETGLRVKGPFVPLQPVKQTSGKIVHAFAVKADLDLKQFAGGHFEMEWPPRSGRKQSFPEFDRVGYFSYPAALEKVIAYQRPFLVELNRKLAREMGV